jgi:hypothetical protein
LKCRIFSPARSLPLALRTLFNSGAFAGLIKRYEQVTLALFVLISRRARSNNPERQATEARRADQATYKPPTYLTEYFNSHSQRPMSRGTLDSVLYLKPCLSKSTLPSFSRHYSQILTPSTLSLALALFREITISCCPDRKEGLIHARCCDLMYPVPCPLLYGCTPLLSSVFCLV